MFCRNCGFKLSDDEKICSNCNTPVGCGQNHCQNCGRYISQHSSFCAYCGTNLKSGDNNSNYSNNGFNKNNQYDYNNYNHQQYSQAPYKRKSKMIAGIFAILLGSFGIHNFYIGKNNIAITQLLLSTVGALITCGISAIVVYIWALVEGIMIFTGNIDRDANGVPFED